MPGHPSAQLAERLERVQRDNRRLRRILALGFLGIGGIGLMAQATPRSSARIVEAERILIRDDGGRIRAALGLAADGASTLALADREGTLRATLTVGPDGAGARTVRPGRAEPRGRHGVRERVGGPDPL